MGSKITKAIYKNQREKPVPQQSIREAVGFLSLLLYSIATILIGYVFDIDLIIDQPLKQHYSISYPQGLNRIENSFIIFFILLLSIFCALSSHRFIQLKCSLLCIISQILLYVSLSIKSLVLMMIGEVLLEISYVGILLSAICYLNLNHKTSASFLFTLFFALHSIGVHISVLITPIIQQNTLPGVYNISILFVFLQFFCVSLVFILEKIYLMKKDRNNASMMLMVQNAKVMIQEAPNFKRYIPLFILISINLFCSNQLYSLQTASIASIDILYLSLGSIALAVSGYFLKNVQSISFRMVTFEVLQFVVFFIAIKYPSVGTPLYTILLSGFNTELLSLLPKNYFNLAVGVFVVLPSYLGKMFPDQGIFYLLVCLFTFQIINFISYWYWKSVRTAKVFGI